MKLPSTHSIVDKDTSLNQVQHQQSFILHNFTKTRKNSDVFLTSYCPFLYPGAVSSEGEPAAGSCLGQVNRSSDFIYD